MFASHSPRSLRTWLAYVAVVALSSDAQPARAISVGFFDLGVGNVPADVSTDGALVGGEGNGGDAFLWTEEDGMQTIGGDFRGIDWYIDDGHYSGVTTNTVIMAGRDNITGDNHARVWFGDPDGTGSGWFRLPLQGGVNVFLPDGTALGVAQDNSNYWVAGHRTSPSQQAVRYKHSSLSSTAFGSPPGGNTQNAQFNAASNVGTFAGRERNSAAGGSRQGRYQSDWLDRTGGEGEANYLSPDGTVAVGWDNGEPVWWGLLPGSTARHSIPLLAGETAGEATGANEDGSIIVGWSWDGTTRQNWIWDAINGTREIGAFLASVGITVPGGFNFDESGNEVVLASGSGYDDLTIVGNGDAATDRGYVAHLGPALSGDFDRDGDVDGDDFLIWQAGFGVDAGGDADNDGDTDGDDFLIWQSQFGSGIGTASAAVPEPASVALLIVVAAIGVLSRRGGISRLPR